MEIEIGTRIYIPELWNEYIKERDPVKRIITVDKISITRRGRKEYHFTPIPGFFGFFDFLEDNSFTGWFTVYDNKWIDLYVKDYNENRTEGRHLKIVTAEMEEKIRGFASLEARIEELETELRDLNAQKDEVESFLKNS